MHYVLRPVVGSGMSACIVLDFTAYVAVMSPATVGVATRPFGDLPFVRSGLIVAGARAAVAGPSPRHPHQIVRCPLDPAVGAPDFCPRPVPYLPRMRRHRLIDIVPIGTSGATERPSGSAAAVGDVKETL